MAEMLSLEEEKTLSRLLVDRMSVWDLIASDEDSLRQPTPTELEVIHLGDLAAQQLVSSYMPFLERLARNVYGRRRQGSGVELQDLINEATVAAMKCTRRFDLVREGHEYGGRRFNTYCSLAVYKALNRMTSNMGTPVSAPPDVITASWVWGAASDEIRAQTGRAPTDEEVARATELNPDEVVRNIPHRNLFVNLDDPYSTTVVPDYREQMIRLAAENQADWELLEQVLNSQFREDVVEVFLSFLGRGRDYPRTFEEISEDTGRGPRISRNLLGLINDSIVHPYFRTALKRVLASIEESLEE